MTYARVLITEESGSLEEWVVDVDDAFYAKFDRFIGPYTTKEQEMGEHWDGQVAGTQPLLTNKDIERIVYALRDLLRHCDGNVKKAYSELLSRFEDCADKNGEGYEEWERGWIEKEKLYGGIDHWRDAL